MTAKSRAARKPTPRRDPQIGRSPRLAGMRAPTIQPRPFEQERDQDQNPALLAVPAPAQPAAEQPGAGGSNGGHPVAEAAQAEPAAEPDQAAQPMVADEGPDSSEEHPDSLEQLLHDAETMEEMLRDTLRGSAERSMNGSKALRLGQRSGPRRARRLHVILGAAAAAVMFIAGTLALIHVVSHSPHDRSGVSRSVGAAPPTAPAPTAAAVNAAASWAGRTLSSDARIIADRGMSRALREVGFRHVLTVAPSSPSGARDQAPSSFDYVVATSALRAGAPAGGPVDRAVNSSVPIAVFGSGARELVVRQVSSVSAADAATRRRADEQTRLSSERQLVANPAIKASPSARALLGAGALDLRAATVLALMANSSHVDLLAINVDKSEQAAGLPARSLDVRTDATSTVQAMLSTLPLVYHPSSITPLPDGANRIVWALSPVPPAGLN